ncbi:MAG: hypothetical protein MZV70_05365 [Desulfobacterales bacterium]|nr:hypothetical protein [Desulfobacterales bacterium]
MKDFDPELQKLGLGRLRPAGGTGGQEGDRRHPGLCPRRLRTATPIITGISTILRRSLVRAEVGPKCEGEQHPYFSPVGRRPRPRSIGRRSNRCIFMKSGPWTPSSMSWARRSGLHRLGIEE